MFGVFTAGFSDERTSGVS